MDSVNLRLSVTELKEWLDKYHPEEVTKRFPFTDRVKPKVRDKKVFLSVSFRVSYLDVRESLKGSISEYILDRKISPRELKMMMDRPCFDAEDMLEGRYIREKAMHGLSAADYSIFETSSKRPSVFFELGIAHALGKPWWVIWYQPKPADFDTSYLPGFLQAPQILTFNITGNKRVSYYKDFCRNLLGRLQKLEEGDPFAADPISTLKKSLRHDASSYYAWIPSEGVFANLPQKIDSLFSQLEYKRSELKNIVFNGSELVSICALVYQSAIVLVETTDEDPGAHYILGYAYGLGGNRLIINIHKKTKKVISMWRDMPEISWSLDTAQDDIISGLAKKLANWKGGG